MENPRQACIMPVFTPCLFKSYLKWNAAQFGFRSVELPGHLFSWLVLCCCFIGSCSRNGLFLEMYYYNIDTNTVGLMQTLSHIVNIYFEIKQDISEILHHCTISWRLDFCLCPNFMQSSCLPLPPTSIPSRQPGHSVCLGNTSSQLESPPCGQLMSPNEAD